MGNDEHLMVGPECRERTPHSDRRRATNSGIDLVEDQHWRAFGEYKAQGQHCSGEFSARGHLGQRLELHAGIRSKSECDITSGNASNLDLESGFW